MGVALAMFPLTALVLRPVSGVLSDRFDCRVILIISTACNALLFPVTLLASTVLLFMVIRLVHGATFSSMTTAQASTAVKLIPEQKLGTGIGFFSCMLSLGVILGPMLGLHMVEKYSYAAAFWLPFGFAVAGVVLQLFIRMPDNVSGSVSRRLSMDSLYMPRGTFVMFSLMLAAFLHGMITNYVAVLAREHGLSDYASLYFLSMGLGLLFSRLFAGYIADRGFLVHLVCASEVVMLSIAMGLVFTTSPVVFLLCGAVLGMAVGAVTPSYQTMLVLLADKGQHGVANSMYYIGMDGGVCLALISGGVIADALGLENAFIAGALGQLVTLGIFLKYAVPQYHAAIRRRSDH